MSFTLDKTIFTPTLYKQVTDVWFPNVDLGGQALDPDTARRWFQGTPDERAHFDGICRDAFAHALEAIGPDAYPEASVQPFLEEIERAESKGSEEAAWTALSLTLLLDQMPRNIYRTDAGLRKVYTHYDRMAYQLVTALLNPNGNILRLHTHPLFRHSGAHRMWFYMPLMHSEEMVAHDKVDRVLSEYKQECQLLDGWEREDTYQGTKMFVEAQRSAESEHRDILERFGRYPHRNKALGRQSTAEEVEFLQGGGATFGVGQAKDEL